MTTLIGYGKSDVIGSPFDFYTNVALQGVTGGLVTGSTFQMNNNKIVFHIGATLAAATVTLPQNPPDGAVAEISNSVNTFNITAITVNPATSYPGSASTSTSGSTVSDNIIGTALSGGSGLNAGVTLRYEYTLNGDNTKGAGPRTWIRVA
jgi:hypothetical protein